MSVNHKIMDTYEKSYLLPHQQCVYYVFLFRLPGAIFIS
jgi:hypothetical protein